MRWKKTLQLVDVHCEGEIGKVITGGVVGIPGETMLDKMNYINEVDDSLRRLVVLEPRGCLQMSVNLLLPPTRPEAQAGFVVLQADKAHPMSGSNCICVVTALLELGMLPMQEPETTVVLDTPAGLVTARARCADGRCLSVSLDMVPSFVEHLDVAIETEAFGTIKADIAFGGVYYALIDVEQVGLSIAPEHARELADTGVALKEAINRQISVRHPLFEALDDVAYVMFRNRVDDSTYQTCTTLPPGRVDRSPCGTGSSANLATLAARGLVEVGDQLVSRSTINGEFQVQLLGRTDVAGRPAVLPRITGRAWIYGIQQLGVDPDDPLAEGFMLSDTWGRRFPSKGSSCKGRAPARRSNERHAMGVVTMEAESSVRRHGGRYIYEELRKQILTLQLKPGAQLDEVSLAAQFGVSRSPVRDALARLISEGLVTILPNRTTLVTPFEIEEFPHYIAALDLTQRAVTRLAAVNRTEQELERIREANVAYVEALGSGNFQDMSELNKAFHLEIARAGHNPYLTRYYEKLLGEGQRLLHLHFDFIVSSQSLTRPEQDHDEIVQAIANRQADAAEEASHVHTLLFRDRFLEFMKQNMTKSVSIL